MSGISDSTNCPNCGCPADMYSDWKPFNYTSITCHECGLMIGPELKYMTLEELNEGRVEIMEWEELSELPKQDKDIW